MGIALALKLWSALTTVPFLIRIGAIFSFIFGRIESKPIFELAQKPIYLEYFTRLCPGDIPRWAAQFVDG